MSEWSLQGTLAFGNRTPYPLPGVWTGRGSGNHFSASSIPHSASPRPLQADPSRPSGAWGEQWDGGTASSSRSPINH